jgi:hypothetical protein
VLPGRLLTGPKKKKKKNSNRKLLGLLQVNDQENLMAVTVLHYRCLTVYGNKLVKSFAERNTGNQRYLTW